MKSFDEFFKRLTSHSHALDWQRDLASQKVCGNRLIRIPTGFGKTLGVLAAWLWHRVQNRDDTWPRRLVWCLPMRVLVEQTEQEVHRALAAIDTLREGKNHTGKVGVHLLMGGVDSGEWHLYPEHCAVLIGTQDMLLSRAMNRGYASPRARWPMEFGLLNHDCLWVMDEVQLMDVGLATSAQLQAFRDYDSCKMRSLRPCYTWWMSATLQSDWLAKSPDTIVMKESLPQTLIPSSKRQGRLWDDVVKTCRRVENPKDAEFAQLIVDEHCILDGSVYAPTLVVLNTVDRAVEIYKALKKDRKLESRGTEIRLVHSRFRPSERSSWRHEFLARETSGPRIDRIIVATQVVEAGVDISSALLITEIAPWPSLVQRFGRCARWGGRGEVIVVDLSPKDEKAAAPYTKAELEAASEALSQLCDVAPLDLESFEETHRDLLPRLYPYEPQHLLLRHELLELFDTTPDLSGADIDISRFIRSGEERDLHVFWADVPEKDTPPPELRETRDALCSVPFLRCRDWLCGKETSGKKAPRLKKGMRAWVWDWPDGCWRMVERRDLYPGQTVLVDANCGGYLMDEGWSQDSTDPVMPLTASTVRPDVLADASQDSEAMSASEWQTIAVHGRETGKLARNISLKLAPSHAALFELAGRWHDVGKVHPAFNNSIVGAARPKRHDLAKAPKAAWLPLNELYPMSNGKRRAGFRHELASVLAMIEVLKRHNPDHPALLGPWRTLLEKAGMPPSSTFLPPKPLSILEQEILNLDAPSFNLVSYLICAHHGKIRLVWHLCPADQASGDEEVRIRGLRNGDMLPSLPLAANDLSFHVLPQTRVDLAPATAGLNPHTGASWSDRVLELLSSHGPFTLAWFEALLRAADQRASSAPVQDELLEEELQS